MIKKNRPIFITAAFTLAALSLAAALSACSGSGEQGRPPARAEAEVQNETQPDELPLQESQTPGNTANALSSQADFSQPSSSQASSTSEKANAADYILPDSNERLYTAQELNPLTPEQLRIARNEIYARHGRIFNSEDLQTYFQGKNWYRGTIEPDQFDTSRLNAFEKDNLKLLEKAETESAVSTSLKGYPKAPNYDAFKEWDASHPGRKVQNRLFNDGTGNVLTSDNSRVITHNGYYEVTHCTVTVDDVYPKNLLDGKKVGDKVLIEKEELIITGIETRADGFRDYLLTYVNKGSHSAVLTDNGFEELLRLKERSEGFYSNSEGDVCEPTRILYEGSLYFYDNAKIATGIGDSSMIITAKEYFETAAGQNDLRGFDYSEYLSFGRAGGLQENGSIFLLGNLKYDEYFYLTGFTETSRNWAG